MLAYTNIHSRSIQIRSKSGQKLHEQLAARLVNLPISRIIGHIPLCVAQNRSRAAK